jgi:DNA-binding XRE family transcriptional regulator
MPGKKISKNQVRDYMTYRKSGNSQKKAASKVDISEKSGRNIESGSKDKVQKTREWRTRANPFETVWDDFVVPMLKGHPTLDASFIMEKLQEKYEGQFPDNKLRTFQRHVREWKALYGKDKKIIFRQEHYPGIRGISDFTELKNIDISINGVPFKHLLYHFRLAYSGWSYMKVIQGGESFSALSEGLQEALWRLGGSPVNQRPILTP